MIEISFIVIGYNAERTIERTLRSISAQTDVSSYEILVIDDGSTDATSEIVRAYAASDTATRLLTLPENRGRGAARAEGVALARGRFIATVDSDIVLPTHWLRRCREELRRADAVAGIPLPDGEVQYIFSRFSLHPRPVPSFAQITGNNALYRREVFDEVSYDVSLRNGEDIALSHDMARRGIRMAILEDLHVRHEEAKDFRQSLAWLYESGVGSSRQLMRYRRVRLADLATFLWILSFAAPAAATPRRARVILGLSPLLLTIAVSYVHTRNKFFLHREKRSTIALATLTNASLIFGYFVGRMRGLFHRG